MRKSKTIPTCESCSFYNARIATVTNIRGELRVGEGRCRLDRRYCRANDVACPVYSERFTEDESSSSESG